MLRIRLTSFLVGFGVASGLALFQLRQDIFKGNEFLAAQVCSSKLFTNSCASTDGVQASCRLVRTSTCLVCTVQCTPDPLLPAACIRYSARRPSRTIAVAKDRY